MKASNIWQVMTPIKGATMPHERWWNTRIVALQRSEAIRMAEQAALALGFSFDGDIELNHIGRCFTEEG